MWMRNIIKNFDRIPMCHVKHSVSERRMSKALFRKKLDFKPTYFEIMTILAFNYFKKQKIDYGVIEVGLGGALDATNIIESLVSVVAPISHDHTHILGTTLHEIALAKAGIIKEGCSVVSSPQKKRLY